jgi:peroxiredoxin
MKISELVRDEAAFRRRDIQVAVVLQSDPATLRFAFPDEGLPFPVICDPSQRIFALYGVTPGSFLGYIAPAVLLAAFWARRQGFVHGRKEGNEFQVPAVFLIDRDGTVARSYYGRNLADLPDNPTLLREWV